MPAEEAPLCIRGGTTWRRHDLDMRGLCRRCGWKWKPLETRDLQAIVKKDARYLAIPKRFAIVCSSRGNQPEAQPKNKMNTLLTNTLLATSPTDCTPSALDALCDGHDVGDNRKKSLAIAIELGADNDTLIALRDCVRLARKETIVLPPHRYENLSRGRGWARKGKKDKASWGERVEGGYEVDAGRWTIGGNDGFSRKDETVWDVTHISVGGKTWTIAN